MRNQWQWRREPGTGNLFSVSRSLAAGTFLVSFGNLFIRKSRPYLALGFGLAPRLQQLDLYGDITYVKVTCSIISVSLLSARVCVRACMYVCVQTCACVCVHRTHARALSHACMHVHKQAARVQHACIHTGRLTESVGWGGGGELTEETKN